MAVTGVVVETPERFRDDRGWFSEIGRMGSLPIDVRQAAHSRSQPGVLRGLHYHQRQSDLWYLVRGRVQLGLVDVRERGRPRSEMLLLEEGHRVIIPPGVAHGYLALEVADVLYLTSQEYDPDDEHGIAWNDPQLHLEWASPDPILSPRDRSNPPLSWHDIPTF